jgi:hypothetical protein
MAPDLRRKVDAARIAREAREAEMKKQVDAQVSCRLFGQFCMTTTLLLLGCFSLDIYTFLSTCVLLPRGDGR